MASHVFVIDSAARRTQVKTTPGSYLRDVLDQACKSKGLNADHFELKQGNKTLDLSLSIRLSGLSSGAKLDLVQTSRTPSVISVALQLPDSIGSSRLTDKFPSNTSIWQILRRFESGAAGQAQAQQTTSYNFTQRGAAEVQDGASGAGRMYYEMPVITVLGRELNTLADLQKTLGQLGLNKGSSLLRLTFRRSDLPLEEAMKEISEFFKEDGPSNAGTNEPTATPAPDSNLATEPEPAAVTEAIASIPSNSEAGPSNLDLPGADTTVNLETAKAEAPTPELTAMDIDPIASDETSTIPGPDQRPVTIFQPPSSSTPQAALASYNPNDYEPTIDHAKSHQASLSARGRNQRLLSDAETAELEQSKAEQLAKVAQIVILIRLPDQSRIQGTFTKDDTTAALYSFVRNMIVHADQPFQLKYMDAKARQSVLSEGEQKLIRDLRLQNRTLVNFVWADGAAPATRSGPSLKEEYREKAQVLKVDNAFGSEENAQPSGSQGESSAEAAKPEQKKGKGNFEAKMKKILGGLGKK
ncbi:MAG: hypothetical protein M1820_000453 [Bogoriella megaspora]|nr:MAG: hypothetical protein M1820_000453 [Bogoriella megaspora]